MSRDCILKDRSYYFNIILVIFRQPVYLYMPAWNIFLLPKIYLEQYYSEVGGCFPHIPVTAMSEEFKSSLSFSYQFLELLTSQS